MPERTPWTVRSLYLYLVCFATLMMIVTGLVRLAVGLADWIYPEPLDYPGAVEMRLRYEAARPQEPPPTPEELERLKAEERRWAEESARRRRVRNLVSSLALVLVPLPVYLYHWHRIGSGD